MDGGWVMFPLMGNVVLSTMLTVISYGDWLGTALCECTGHTDSCAMAGGHLHDVCHSKHWTHFRTSVSVELILCRRNSYYMLGVLFEKVIITTNAESRLVPDWCCQIMPPLPRAWGLFFVWCIIYVDKMQNLIFHFTRTFKDLRALDDETEMRWGDADRLNLTYLPFILD